MKDSCLQHKKEVAGVSDMKLLAENIGDLHYESLAELLYWLANKINNDSAKDYEGRKNKLANKLKESSFHLYDAADKMNSVWQISKPFMKNG